MSRGLVLIVDDERDIQGFLSTLVGFFGYTTVTASDGQQAVSVALQRKPDLVLMDLAMPRMDGFKAIARLKADPATLDIPIIAFSGLYVDSPVRARLIEAGCSDFLPKPIDTDLLHKSMVMAIEGHKPPAPPKEDSPLEIDFDLDREQRRQHVTRLIRFFKAKKD